MRPSKLRRNEVIGMDWRFYDSGKDKQAAHRIWKEVGWIADDVTPEGLDRFITGSGHGFVCELNGEAECLVLTAKGDLRYQHETLPLGCVTGVTTSRIARKQKFAGRLTATAVATEAAEGAAVASLGIFDQGFYNKLGFGNGSYEPFVKFVTSDLMVDVTPRVPLRLTMEDWPRIHEARLKRRRLHGSGSLFAPEFTMGRMYEGSNQFGLGYADDPGGGLSHLIFCTASNVGRGPYRIKYLVYRTGEQLLELLALLKSLADQVYTVEVHEPVEVQLTDFLRQPFKTRELSGGAHKTGIDAYAWWQMRICDLPACLAQTHLPSGEVRMNLTLTDPIEEYLDDDLPWRGVGGEYVVTLCKDSGAEAGHDDALPTLTASVNAFTRLWLGVRPASGLAVSDELQGPPELLEALDEVIRVPQPRPDWDF